MNKHQAHTIVRLTLSEFEQWLMRGVCRLSISHCWPSADTTSRFTSEGTSGSVFASLPAKYAEPLNTESGVLALVDDVQQISCASSVDTSELRARLYTLGETWLPIEFLSDLVTPPRGLTSIDILSQVPSASIDPHQILTQESEESSQMSTATNQVIEAKKPKTKRVPKKAVESTQATPTKPTKAQSSSGTHSRSKSKASTTADTEQKAEQHAFEC